LHSLHFDFPSNTFTHAATGHTTIHLLHSCNPVLRIYLFFNFQIIQLLHTHSLCIKLPNCLFINISFTNSQMVISTTISPSEILRHQAQFNVISYLSRRNQFNGMFSHQGKSKCTHTCFNMEIHCT